MISKIKPWLYLSITTLVITDTIYSLYIYYKTGIISGLYIYFPNLIFILTLINLFISCILILRGSLTENKIESKIINITSESTLGELLESKSTLETTIATIEHLIKLKQDDNS